MTESNLIKSTLLALPRSARLFRNNVGMAWMGVKLHSNPGTLTLRDAHPVHYGLTVGSSDLIGWNSVIITPEMVGKKVAIFTAVEVKAGTTRTTKDQLNFIENVRSAGGIAGISRSPDEAAALITSFK